MNIDRTQSDREFREIVCNLTRLKPDDKIFEKMEDLEKQKIKESKRAVDMTRAIYRLVRGNSEWYG